MASKYILQHSAEAIDHKLDLIAENKNLLEYPYTFDGMSAEDFPEGFINVGDGSILVQTKLDPSITYRLKLTTVILPAGTYTISLHATELADEQTAANTRLCDLSAWVAPWVGSSTDKRKRLAQVNSNSTASFSLPEEAIIDFVLSIGSMKPGSTITVPDFLLMPMIECGNTASTDWVPYMKDIGSYVDERFNSLFRLLLDNNSINTSNVIKIGETELTETQLKKILALIDSVELDG